MARILKTRPRGYQVKGAQFAWREKTAGLIMDPGTGKTLTSLLVVGRSHKREKARRVLVLCPKTAKGVWVRQLKQHLSLTYSVSVDLEDDPRSTLHFNILNYDRVKKNLKMMRRQRWDFIISDESHRLKNRNSSQSKAVGKLQAPRKLILTGTPVGDQEYDLWAQFRFMAPEIFGDKWLKFKKKYLRKSGYQGFKLKMKKHLIKPFIDKASTKLFRISLEEALGMAPETNIPLEYDLPPATAKVYRELEREFISEFGSSVVTTPLAITNMIRLHQLVGGFLKTDDGKIHQVDDSRLKTFLDWFKDYPRDQKLVIFCRFREEIKQLEEALKKHESVESLHGGTKDRDRVWQDFQDKKKPRILIVQVQTGGASIDLFAANIGVFYSKDWSFINNKQCKHRLLRGGQRKKVIFYHLTARNTIDEDIDLSLHRKTNTALAVLTQMRRRMKMAKAATAKTPAPAKTATAKTAAPAEKRKAPPPIEKPDYGIDYVANALELAPFTVRTKLRQMGIEKEGRAYDFKTKSAADAVVKQLRGAQKKIDG